MQEYLMYLYRIHLSQYFIFLLTIILIYFSIVLGITSIVTSKLFSSLKIMCPSYISKVWKIIGNFFGIFNFRLHWLCAAPLNLPVIVE